MTFEKARLRVGATLRQQGHQTGLVMQTRCAQILGGAGTEHAFAVGVVSTLIKESAQLIEPYRTYSSTLLAIHPSDRALANAARDTTSVATYMARLAREDGDPCRIAQDWQATGWARNNIPELAGPPSAATIQAVSHDAMAASQRLANAGISDQITQTLTTDLNPIALS